MESMIKNKLSELTKISKPLDLLKVTVVKRNGTIVPFQKERIYRAIEAAFRDTKKVGQEAPLSFELKATIDQLCEKLVQQLLKLASKGTCLTVEGIQDFVEVYLMKKGHYDVARDYIGFRDRQKIKREHSPQHLKIYRQDRATQVRFNPMKIALSLERCFRKVYQIEGNTPENLVKAVNAITQNVVSKSLQASHQGEPLYTEALQDWIEQELMNGKFYKEAKEFILHRAAKEAKQETLSLPLESPTARQFPVIGEEGNQKIITESQVRSKITYACRGLEKEVDIEDLIHFSLLNFYEGMKEKEVDFSHILAARARIERDPAYSKVAARLLLDILYRETLEISFSDTSLEKAYKEYFKKYIKNAVSYQRLSPQLLDFDLEELSSHLEIKRDDLFQYLGLQTLYDRYFIQEKNRRLETPQIFWMRVAMGLALGEGEKKNEKAIEFYHILSQFLFTSSTPTLFNAGTLHSQLSSCYLSTIGDDLHHIFKTISDDAQLSKWAGGIGNDWTYVRATGALIRGTNGRSQGVIPFLKVANDTAIAVNQGGKRKGAMCAYLEVWHLDMEDFLELRKNTGDERRRTHDMNTANWIPDLFMKRVQENGSWTLFSPSDVPDLHDLYGEAFEKRYEEYEQMVEEGKITLYKKVEAIMLWRKMLSMLFETGHPWLTFKDPSNIRSPQDHVGVVHSSNLCTEILLNTSAQETAVCNLGSINLAAHVDEKGLQEEKLASTIKTAVRMLDNVIDINFYPIKEARNANVKHRPIGLGLMGFQDALYKLGYSYASHEAVEFSDRSMEMLSYYAILASTELAEERGCYASFSGSKWSRGLLPIDTIDLLEKERKRPIQVDRKTTMDWEYVRQMILKKGMRNSNTMAIAPTATIANICGVIPSIEPSYKHLFVKSNLSGEFTVINPHLVEKLKECHLWNQEMVEDLKYFDGSIQEIEKIPEEIKRLFFTAFEIDPNWIIQCAAKRQKWLDMGQSLNLYISNPSGKMLQNMYFTAWESGLKTTYYLRATAATQIEKSSMDINRKGIQPRWMKNKSASSKIQVDRTEPTICNLEEGCESCQ